MDRAMSVEERIKRAEEIYNRRSGQYINDDYKKNKKRKSIKKMIMQIFVFLAIYIAFYIFTNSEYIFSKEFLNQIKQSFSQNSSIYNAYNDIKSYINEKMNFKGEESIVNNENQNDESIVNDKKDDGPAKQEADEKDDISFIMPVKGKISSAFGWRTPTTDTVPKYHTGIDIAAKEGTVIRSATDGKISSASSKGDFGKHYLVKTKELTIVYAHCKKLYLKKGDKVKQGEKIAEVGSTGNSTGPHLHFEIRKGKELIDPQTVLNI